MVIFHVELLVITRWYNFLLITQLLVSSHGETYTRIFDGKTSI